jgi:hypothetical protein
LPRPGSGYFSRVGKLPFLHRTDSVGSDGDHGNGMPGQGRELHLITSTMLVYQYNRTDIASLQSFFGNVPGKNGKIKFLNH